MWGLRIKLRSSRLSNKHFTHQGILTALRAPFLKNHLLNLIFSSYLNTSRFSLPEEWVGLSACGFMPPCLPLHLLCYRYAELSASLSQKSLLLCSVVTAWNPLASSPPANTQSSSWDSPCFSYFHALQSNLTSAAMVTVTLFLVQMLFIQCNLVHHQFCWTAFSVKMEHAGYCTLEQCNWAYEI